METTYFDGQNLLIEGRLLKTARLKDEMYEDLEKPEKFIEELRNKQAGKADLFTFWQRLPDTAPRYHYPIEWDNVAALSITSFQEWFEKRTDSNVRRAIAKAKKRGVEIRLVPFSDALVSGIADVFNGDPVRQGKPMRHYKKDIETLKEGYRPELHRTDFIGAFYEGDMIGFMMLVYADRYANIAQIMSKTAHWDKSPNNALLAKAVEICEAKRLPHLVYTKWYRQGVTEFKRRNGFEKIDLPRYYVPLTARGKVAIALGLHHGLKGAAPEGLKDTLRRLRRKWYSVRRPARDSAGR